ncbi:hypothetical protein HN928_02725 [bacterium]|jgi:tetratricopeptide (TPR) repeat protein|nr:hypothetical protein [bacterium]MBT5989154.1 hypothetical protein [bacterium]MBT7087860.1 hypothetical protein [bacterium]
MPLSKIVSIRESAETKIARLEQDLATDPGDLKLIDQLIYAYSAGKRDDDAITLSEANFVILERYPSIKPQFILNLAVLYIKVARYDDAITLLKSHLPSIPLDHPLNPQLIDLLAEAFAKLAFKYNAEKKYDKTITLLEKWLNYIHHHHKEKVNLIGMLALAYNKTECHIEIIALLAPLLSKLHEERSVDPLIPDLITYLTQAYWDVKPLDYLSSIISSITLFLADWRAPIPEWQCTYLMHDLASAHFLNNNFQETIDILKPLLLTELQNGQEKQLLIIHMLACAYNETEQYAQTVLLTQYLSNHEETPDRQGIKPFISDEISKAAEMIRKRLPSQVPDDASKPPAKRQRTSVSSSG